MLAIGTVAYDTVQTPAGRREEALGGSVAYFSVAGSYFTDIGLVAVVGDDFDPVHVDLLKSHGVDLSGLETKQGRTFRWSGVYGSEDVNTRDTLDTQLNVLEDFAPRLSDAHRTQSYLFLANNDPELQMSVLDQMAERPRLVALDTMNFWIDGSREALGRVVSEVDVLFMDESEVRSFTGEASLLAAARRIMDMGPAVVVVKRGEHGVLVVQESGLFAAPAYPVEGVVDPTGRRRLLRRRIRRVPCGNRRPQPSRVSQGRDCGYCNGVLRGGELQPRPGKLSGTGRHRGTIQDADGNNGVRPARRGRVAARPDRPVVERSKTW